MNRRLLFPLWGGLLILCAGLGFLPEPAGALRVICRLCALASFLPPAALVWLARKQEDAHTLALVRRLAAWSLGLTAAMIVVNFLSAFAGEALGEAVYAMLIVLSSPMICSGSWALSLFLWACLLMASRPKK